MLAPQASLPLCVFALTIPLALASPKGAEAQAPQKGGAVDFQRDVRPILSDNCFSCHGPDESTRRVRLRLDTEDGAFVERPNGHAIVAGDTEASLVYQRITHDDEGRRMPPPALSNKTLSEDQIDILRRWIESGASWDQHWAFKTVQRHEPPAVTDEGWVRTPIDRFVLKRLEADGLAPAPEADRRTLARRVALDLTGLPPDPGTLEGFLNDGSDGAYEKLVDRLLDSKHWGEHRARYWLDAARYGDTHGIHIDNYREITHDGSGERAGMHLYLNGELVQEYGSTFFAKPSGSMRVDRPLVLGRGMTTGRNDRDDLRMRYFSGGGIADLRVFNRPVTVEEARDIANWATLQGAREKAPAELDAEERDLLRLYYLSVKDAAYQQLLARDRELEREWREIRRRGGVTHVMQEVADQEPFAHVLNRGMYDDKRERVIAGTPSALPPMADSLPRNRLGLAKWLVDDAHPLTSRVTVNRFWQQVFGAGLVPSTEDFGAQGNLPSHPELLDWLALGFRESDWDVKQFFRTVVTSATYRQAALMTPEKHEKDPRNRLLSRGPRFRMDAEMIRDHALASSGLLVRTIGGPSVKPYQPEGVWERVAMGGNTSVYEQDTGDDLYRRSLYTFWKRSAPPASMDIFNAPTRLHFTVRRERTNTPLQALATMNDTQYVEASRYLAQRAMRETGNDFDRRLDYVTTRLIARTFDDRERAVAKDTYLGLEALYGADDDEARRLLEVGESGYDEALPQTESAAWTLLTSQLMNLDEVLNK